MTARAGRPRAEASAFLERAATELDAIPESRDRTDLRAFLLDMQADAKLVVHDLVGARATAEEARTLAASVGDGELVLDCDLLLARIDVVGGRSRTACATACGPPARRATPATRRSASPATGTSR